MREALQIGKLQRARVLAGHRGLNRLIEYVDVIEMPDIRPWVRPHILFLTSLYAIRHDIKAQQELICYLAEHGAAGVVLDTQSFLKGAPAEVLQAAEASDFPLIEIPEDASYIEIITPVLEAVFTRRRAQDEFMDDLLRGSLRTDEAVQGRARELGWNLQGVRTVLVVEVDAPQPDPKQPDATRPDAPRAETTQTAGISYPTPEKDPGTPGTPGERLLSAAMEATFRTLPGEHIVASHHDSVVIMLRLVPARTPYARPQLEELARQVKDAAGQAVAGKTISVAVGTPCQRPGQVGDSLAAARETLTLGRQVVGSDRISFHKDLGLYRFLQKLDLEQVCQRFVEEQIGPLIEHDRRHGTQLVRTLEAFLDSGCHLARAASHLYVHRNSLKYRLACIKRLLQLDKLEGECLSSLALAVKAHRLYRAADASRRRTDREG